MYSHFCLPITREEEFSGENFHKKVITKMLQTFPRKAKIFEKLTNQLTETIDSSVALALHNKNQEVEVIHLL